MKKLMFVIIITSMFLLSGCKSNETESIMQHSTENETENITQKQKLSVEEVDLQEETGSQEETGLQEETESQEEENSQEDTTECNHNYMNATCLTPGKCVFCGKVSDNLADHVFSEANCTTPATCSVCGEINGEALGHTLVKSEAVEATCCSSGLTEGWHCGRCDYVSQEPSKTEKLAHTPKVGVCTLCNQAVYVEKWKVSGISDGEVWAYLYNADEKDRYWLEIDGNGAIKDYPFGLFENNAPWRKDFANPYKIKKIVINEGVTCIGINAFNGLPYLEEVTLPETLEQIRDWAFFRCEKLDSIVLNEGLEVIGSNAFDECPLISVRIPDTVKYIGVCSFNCYELTELYIPQNVFIEGGAFYRTNKTSPLEVFYAGTMEQWLKTAVLDLPNRIPGTTGDYFYQEQIIHCTDGDYHNPVLRSEYMTYH